jgi:uncharacterized paraquat-inducible protein A
MRPIPTEPMLDSCAVCAKETRHEPDRDGAYACTVCAANARAAANKSDGKTWILVAAIIFAIAIASVLWLQHVTSK